MKKKRGQNEGSIYQRADGKWVGVISAGYRNGKRLRRYLYGPTKDAVHRQVVESLRNQHLGLNVAPQKQNMEHYLTHWLEDVARPRVRVTTYRSYEQIIRNHLIPGLGKIPLAKLTPQQVQALLHQKHEDGICAEHLRRVLRAALSQAVKWDMVPRNVAKLAESPRSEAPEIHYLTPEQAKTFYESIRGHRLEAVFTVTMCLGLRLGEVLGLQWSDIDFDAGTVRISKQLQRVKGEYLLVEPKTKNARRILPMPEMVATALKEWQATQREERIFAGEDWRVTGFLFTRADGMPMDARNLRKALKDLLAAANLPTLRFHDLRHTCATLLLSRNVHPRVVMDVLGHSQINLTLGTYSHVVAKIQQEAIAQIQDVFEPTMAANA